VSGNIFTTAGQLYKKDLQLVNALERHSGSLDVAHNSVGRVSLHISDICSKNVSVLHHFQGITTLQYV